MTGWSVCPRTFLALASKAQVPESLSSPRQTRTLGHRWTVCSVQDGRVNRMGNEDSCRIEAIRFPCSWRPLVTRNEISVCWHLKLIQSQTDTPIDIYSPFSLSPHMFLLSLYLIQIFISGKVFIELLVTSEWLSSFLCHGALCQPSEAYWLLWFVAHIHNWRQATFHFEVGENKDVLLFHPSSCTLWIACMESPCPCIAPLQLSLYSVPFYILSPWHSAATAIVQGTAAVP